MIITGTALFFVEAFVAAGCSLGGGTRFYWGFIIEQHMPIHFYVAGLISLLLILAGWIVRDLRWFIRLGLTALFVLPLPISLFAGFVFPGPVEYVGSVTLHGHVYHLSTAELSGTIYYLHGCDSIGFFCHPVADFWGPVSDPSRVGILADPDRNAIYVVGCGTGGHCGISHEFYVKGGMSP